MVSVATAQENENGKERKKELLRRDGRLERKERDGEREGGGYNENRKREKSNE